jgi:alkanesulfonate monooxygenase SsuD/methylene tetrahydromethanopterin reductase-like flavin-dependent oxidoreductase (luciferase family)
MTDFGYHPAVVAQKAATMQILSGGRFRLGLGAGENLNEHVVGKRWPAVGERHEMFGEAVDVISQLFEGGRGRRGARREDPPVHRRGFTEIARPDRRGVPGRVHRLGRGRAAPRAAVALSSG